MAAIEGNRIVVLFDLGKDDPGTLLSEQEIRCLFSAAEAAVKNRLGAFRFSFGEVRARASSDYGVEKQRGEGRGMSVTVVAAKRRRSVSFAFFFSEDALSALGLEITEARQSLTEPAVA